QRARYRYHAIGPVDSRPLLVPDAHRLPVAEMVPAASVLRRVNGQHAAPAAPLPDPDHGIGRQPVVRVDHVESSNHALGYEHVIHDRAAHIVHFIDKIRVQIEWTAMIVDAMNTLVVLLAAAHAREHMHLMAPAL